MFETMFQISLGSRAGILNRAFTIIMLVLVVIQLWRLLRFHVRLVRWRYRLHLLEQEAREEGVVTVTDPQALPPLDPYGRFWEMVPSMAIMFGLLGTFIGLTLSLSEIPVTGQVDAIQQGLSRAIPSMGTAFWTSLCGLVIAITVRIANSFMSSWFRHRVVNLLMVSEPQVIEALESAAFQQGRDGALLRPHGIRELLWHQNRLLNQTVARVAPQISEGIARGLGQVSQLLPQAAQDNQSSLVGELRKMTGQIGDWHEQQKQHLSEQRGILEAQSSQVDQLVQQQKHMTRVLSQELAGFQQQIKRLNGGVAVNDQTSVSELSANTTETPAISDQDGRWSK